MIFDLRKAIVALIIAVVVGLVFMYLLGPILVGLAVPIAVTVGTFFTTWGWVLGVLFGLWYYFKGGAIA